MDIFEMDRKHLVVVVCVQCFPSHWFAYSPPAPTTSKELVTNVHYIGLHLIYITDML
jgi:hypothetical protein